MARKKTITTAKVKKKKWYPIIATKSFNETVLGESYLTEAARLKNKFVTANLSKITNNFRDQSINLTFKITDVKDNRGITSLVGYVILPSFIKRFVRRDKSKIADSFILKDKTGRKIRVKPLIITNTISTRTQRTLIRKAAKDFAKTYLEKITFDAFVDALIKKEFQKKLRLILKKITPIRYAEIRKVVYDNLKLVSFNKQNIVDESIVEEIKKADAEAEKENKVAVKQEEKKELIKQEPRVEVKAKPKPEVVEEPKEKVKSETGPVVEEAPKEEVKPEVKEEPVVEAKTEPATEEIKKE